VPSSVLALFGLPDLGAEVFFVLVLSSNTT
jgi:hypothetical protein